MGGEGRILVLCVDRDNDVGETLGIATPVVGEENVLRVALEYILRRPEDSDSNALFAAVQTYRDLVKKGYNGRVEVALLAGTAEEGVEADMKILRELDEVLSKGAFSGAILVSDGPTDEAVAPLVQSRLPLLSIRRVIVQQSRGVEETFVLMVNYMKKLFTEDKYRKYSLGLTGVFLISYVILSTVVPQIVWPLILFFAGVAMFVKGYEIDKLMREIYASRPITFASILLSSILLLLGLVQGLGALLSGMYKGFPAALGDMMLAPVGAQLIAADLFVLAAALPIFGKIADSTMLLRQSRLADAFAMTTILFSRQLLVEVAKYLSGGGDIRGVLTWSFIVLGFVIFSVAVVPLEKRRESGWVTKSTS